MQWHNTVLSSGRSRRLYDKYNIYKYILKLSTLTIETFKKKEIVEQNLNVSVSYFHCWKVRTCSVDSLMKGILSNFLVRLRLSLFSFKQVPRRKEKEGKKLNYIS